MRKVTQRQFIQKMLDSMFSTIKHYNQTEREVCALCVHRRVLIISVVISVGLCYRCGFLRSLSLRPGCTQTGAGHKRGNGSKI